MSEFRLKKQRWSQDNQGRPRQTACETGGGQNLLTLDLVQWRILTPVPIEYTLRITSDSVSGI